MPRTKPPTKPIHHAPQRITGNIHLTYRGEYVVAIKANFDGSYTKAKEFAEKLKSIGVTILADSASVFD